MSSTKEMEQVGHVYVDAGLIMVGDPCYTLPDEGSHRDEVAKDWGTFCEALNDTRKNGNADGVYKPFGDGTAVVVSSGYGDGTYPVFVKRDANGRIMKLVIDFGDEEDNYTMEFARAAGLAPADEEEE